MGGVDAALAASTASARPVETLDSAALPSGALPTTVCFSGERADEPYVTTSFHQALVRIRL